MANQSNVTQANIWSMQKDAFQQDVVDIVILGAPTNGTSGTGVGMCGPGSICRDLTNKIIYFNSGTKASPVWDVLVNGSSSFGLGNVRFAKSVYSFAVDGGVVGAILPVSGAALPINAVILGGFLDITTAFTSGGSATVALGTSAGSAANSILAATAVASLTAIVSTVLIPKFTAATIVKLSAAGTLQWTVATADLTAGKAALTLAYMVGI